MGWMAKQRRLAARSFWHFVVDGWMKDGSIVDDRLMRRAGFGWCVIHLDTKLICLDTELL
jgi:hypothetical protein